MVTSPNYQVRKGSRLAFELKPLYVDDNEPTLQNQSFCQEPSISSDLECESNDRGSAATPKTHSDTSGPKVNDENGTGVKSEAGIGAYRGGRTPGSILHDSRQRRPGLATTTRWPRERLDGARKPANDLIDYDSESYFSTSTQFWCIVAIHGSTSTWGTPTGEFDLQYGGKDLWRCRTCMYKKSELWFVREVSQCPRCTFPSAQFGSLSLTSKYLGILIFREGAAENTDRARAT